MAADSSRAGAKVEHLGVVAAYLLLSLLLTYPVVRAAAHAIPMDPQIKDWYPGDGDPWHYLWGFWYVARAFTRFPPPLFWTDLVYYPLGFEIPFLPGVGLIMAPAALMQAVVGTVLTYNLLWWLSFALAGYAMYLCARHLLGDRPVAFACGYLFAFSSYRMIHSLEHLPIVLSSFLVPLFALALFAVARRPTVGRSALAGLVLAASAGISWYCTIALGLYLVVALLAGWRRGALRGAVRTYLVPALAGLVVFAVAVAPLVLPLILSPARDSIISRPLAESSYHSADLLAFFLPSPRNPVFGDFTRAVYAKFDGNPYEQTVYPGYVLLALAVVGLALTPRTSTRLFRVLAVVAFVLALGPFLHVAGQTRFDLDGEAVTIPLPYLLLRYVPFVSGMRAPSRFTELLVFALIVLAGYGLARACARLGSRRKAVVLGALLVLATLETTMIPLPVVSASVPRVYADMGRDPGPGSVLEVPLDWRIIRYHYYQTVHGRPMIVGHPVRPREKYLTYPAGIPLVPALRDPATLVDRPDPADARRDAERLGAFFQVRYVVIHREYLAPRVAERIDRFVADNFAHDWRRVDGPVVTYALRAPDPARPLWPETFTLDFGNPQGDFALLTGWSGPERWGAEGPSMQWSSDRESSLILPLGAPADRTLELRLQPLSYPGSPAQALTVSVNGARQATLALKPGWEVYRVALPAAAFRSGLNTLTFGYAFTAVPARVIAGNADRRTLGVAFDQLALIPRR